MQVNIEAVLRVSPADGSTLGDVIALAADRGFSDAVVSDGAVEITVALLDVTA